MLKHLLLLTSSLLLVNPFVSLAKTTPKQTYYHTAKIPLGEHNYSEKDLNKRVSYTRTANLMIGALYDDVYSHTCFAADITENQVMVTWWRNVWEIVDLPEDRVLLTSYSLEAFTSGNVEPFKAGLENREAVEKCKSEWEDVKTGLAKPNLASLPDGIHLYGVDTPYANEIGSIYIVLRKTNNSVVGFDYVRNTSGGNDCFQGIIQDNKIVDVKWAKFLIGEGPGGTLGIDYVDGETIDLNSALYLFEPDSEVDAEMNINNCIETFNQQ
jgi:hypothetical protein